MNILFICNEYPPGRNGGIGSITRTLARGMVAAGHQVFVAGLYAPGYGQNDYEEDQGVRVWRKRYVADIGLLKNDYSLTDTLLLKALKISGLLQWDTVRSLRSFYAFILELIDNYRIDIVEWPDFNEYFPNLPGTFSWPVLPVPLVVKFHGTETYIARNMGEKIDPRTFLLEKGHIARADALISVSQDTAVNYISFYDIGKPVKVLYNSIDIPELGYSPEETTETIVYTGTLTRLKGIYSLLGAWNLVHQVRPQATLRIFGKGKPQLFEPILTAEARTSVKFEGFSTREQLYSAFSKAAAAIFPSYTECFAMAPLEAMAVGCPVIYTQRASGPELIEPNVNGLLVDPDDQRQIADSILLLLENKTIRKEFSYKGRQTIEKKFDIQDSIKDHIRFYADQITRYYTKKP